MLLALASGGLSMRMVVHPHDKMGKDLAWIATPRLADVQVQGTSTDMALILQSVPFGKQVEFMFRRKHRVWLQTQETRHSERQQIGSNERV
jgi:hypothetical protein